MHAQLKVRYASLSCLPLPPFNQMQSLHKESKNNLKMYSSNMFLKTKTIVMQKYPTKKDQFAIYYLVLLHRNQKSHLDRLGRKVCRCELWCRLFFFSCGWM